MKTLLACLLTALCICASAAPGADVVDACISTESHSTKVHYTEIDVTTFDVIEDQEAKKTSTLIRHGKDRFGTWESGNSEVFGLVFNGTETPLTRVIRIDKRNVPSEFSPYEAIWGVVQDGKTSYICATFNFDGIGKSGSFQNIRGLYLIERNKQRTVPFYAVGKVSMGEK